jgi:NAD(P)-dependent dehydrogenase (short-subunit alcohol dehydrogenase family)
MGNLNGKIALVTGAASGIGRAITERFVADGARVVAGDISQEGLDNLSSELGEAIATFLCDVTQEEDVAGLAAFGLKTFQRIDIVVANAGAGTYGLITELPLTEWKRIIDLCLTGVFLTLKHGGSVISDGGSIINIASLNAIQPSQGMSAYCAAKAGVAMLTQVAAMELGSRGVRVNTIAPGLVETNATSGMFSVPVIIEEFKDNATLSRFAQPSEIASVASFLASDESAYMSASFVSVDGGGNTGRYPNLPKAFSQMP